MTKIAALLLAAGNSRRMGGPNKLLMPFHGQPLFKHAVNAIANANFAERILVTGRDNAETKKHAPAFTIVHNPLFEQGFGTSLAAGFSALIEKPEIGGALVMLADMPFITAEHLDRLIDAFDGISVIRPAHEGVPGNPVVLPRKLFAAMTRLGGDQSGQALIKASGLEVTLVESGPACLADIDTQENFAAYQRAD